MTNIPLSKNSAQKELKMASTLHEVDAVWRKYLGRKGLLAGKMRKLKDVSEKERKKRGIQLNKLKKDLDELFDARRSELQEKKYENDLHEDWIDVTRPGQRAIEGSLHPLTKTLYELEDIFSSMGFEVATGPQVEEEWYNFDALNIPRNHPARELHDTFWLKPRSRNLLLRTHTSPVQLRYMQKNQPPIRIISPGRVFRYEATDASHEARFYQMEGLMVDENISVGNFRAVIGEALSKFFKKKVDIRLRPSYFPFVEPGFEVDVTCVACDRGQVRTQRGSTQKKVGVIPRTVSESQRYLCAVCKDTGWLELLGAGMVHPNVLSAVGYNPKNLTGFAFGIGIDRLAMMKYKIDDVRLFYSSDLRFLKQFK